MTGVIDLNRVDWAAAEMIVTGAKYEVNVLGQGWQPLDVARSWPVDHDHEHEETWRLRVREAATGKGAGRHRGRGQADETAPVTIAQLLEHWLSQIQAREGCVFGMRDLSVSIDWEVRGRCAPSPAPGPHGYVVVGGSCRGERFAVSVPLAEPTWDDLADKMVFAVEKLMDVEAWVRAGRQP